LHDTLKFQAIIVCFVNVTGVRCADFCQDSMHDIVRFKPSDMEGPITFVAPELSDKTLLNVSTSVIFFF
jgi:hypothetical protein